MNKGKSQAGSDDISHEEMKTAILNSGYLIEQRVERVFKKSGFLTNLNDTFQDDETKKVREIDITATFLKKKRSEERIDFEIICECENNRYPIVFFTKKSSYLDYVYCIKHLGYSKRMQEILINVGDPEINKPMYKGDFSSQYCNFQLTNKNSIKKWIAKHDDEQHDTIEKLIKFINYRIKRYTANHIKDVMFLNKKLTDRRTTYLSGTFLLPVIVMQGELYKVILLKDNLSLKKINHIKFYKQHIKNHQPNEFYFDIVQENYLPTYIKYLKKEWNLIYQNIKINKDPLLESQKKEMEELTNYLNSQKGPENIL